MGYARASCLFRSRSTVERRSISSIFFVPRLQLSMPMDNPVNATVVIIAMIVMLIMTSTSVNPSARKCFFDGVVKIIILVRDSGRFDRFQAQAALTRPAFPEDVDVHCHDCLRRLVLKRRRNQRSYRYLPFDVEILRS